MSDEAFERRARALIDTWNGVTLGTPIQDLERHALAALIVGQFQAVRLEVLEEAAKVAEDAQDQYRGGASVMARGFGRAIAEEIRALLPAKEGNDG